MKIISYQIKGVSPENCQEIYKSLEGIDWAVKVETTYQEESSVCTAVLHLAQELQEDEELCRALDRDVKEALATFAEGLQLPGVPLAETYVAVPSAKKEKTIPLWAAIGSVITSVILAVLITFGCMSLYHQNQDADIVSPGEGTQVEDDFEALDFIHKIFNTISPLETDKDVLLETVLKAYVSATGDRYAEYFNAEEYQAMLEAQQGEMCGIGVTVVQDTLTISGETFVCVRIADVYVDSPAAKSGMKVGDAIMYIGLGEQKALVQGIGYTQALERMKGEEGTWAEFVVYRANQDADDYEIIEFRIQREKLTTKSVTFAVCQTNEKVGIVRVSTFDNTTAPQFKEAMTALMAAGCESYVIDLRGNGGGLLTSVEDMLTYFLQAGDVMLSTKDKYGREEVLKVGASNANGYIQSGTGTLTAEDLGAYRGLPLVVLVSEHTASAAELFTANIRDYELGQIVGVKTYGKGSMQTYHSLAQYGYEGALKLTTRYYFPPSGEGYDGKGIIPDVEIALSEEAANTNIHLLPHEKDNQLQAAIDLLYP